QRRDFYVYVDEFHNLATLNFGTLLSEGRKYRLNLILTNQYVTQVDPRITSAIAGNVGTIISFRVGALDAEYLEREFAPVFNRYDLMNLPNFSTFVSTLIGGQVSKPFSMDIIPDQTPADDDLGDAIRQLSRKTYGRARAVVETEIAESLEYPLRKVNSGRRASL
ncbi:MAG: ATP-binding protein, partial [Acidobacteria bacterium]|nr:ATP-binding protein [Acidobacteriota bacterium]